jgi:hypothetical protein
MRFLTAVSLILGAMMLCLLPPVLSRRDSVTWFACIIAERDIVYFSEAGRKPPCLVSTWDRFCGGKSGDSCS